MGDVGTGIFYPGRGIAETWNNEGVRVWSNPDNHASTCVRLAASVMVPSSGAAVATLDALEVLAGAGFGCQAFCATTLDPQEEVCIEELLAQQGLPYEIRRVVVAGRPARMLFTRRGRVPVTLFRRAFSQTGVLPEEAEAFWSKAGSEGWRRLTLLECGGWGPRGKAAASCRAPSG